MKAQKIILQIILPFAILFSSLVWSGGELFAQCYPMIKIDGNKIIADHHEGNGINLPTWLKAGQTLEKDQYVFSIAVVEFTVNGTALDYSQNKRITTMEAVPAGKTWRIESVVMDPAAPSYSAVYSYSSPGSYTFISPPCNANALVQVWGAGGGGANGNSFGSAIGGSGGGGGGYAEGVFPLNASASYVIIVGAGGSANSAGSGLASSVGTIGVSASGGGGGGVAANGGTNPPGGVGGAGSGGQQNFTGGAGANYSGSYGGTGGDACNGAGTGGGYGSPAVAGASPGGGGGGGNAWAGNGGAGAPGKVVITFGGSAVTNNANTVTPVSGTLLFGRPIHQLVTTDGCNATYTYTVPAGKIFELKGAYTYHNAGSYTLNIGSACGSSDKGNIVCNNLVSGYPGNGTFNQNTFPLWFQAGTVFSSNGCCSGTQGVEINGIEWTVVP